MTAQLAETAQLVSPQVPVFTVEAEQAPEVSFAIPENSRAVMTVGQRVQVTFPALPETTVSGQISEISAQAQIGAFPAKLVLNNPPAAIQAGMTAELHFHFTGAVSNGFPIPPSALASADDKLVRSGMGFLHPDQAVTLMGEGAKRVNP